MGYKGVLTVATSLGESLYARIQTLKDVNCICPEDASLSGLVQQTSA